MTSNTNASAFLSSRHILCIVLICITLLSFFLKLLCLLNDPTLSRDGCLYLRLTQIWYNTGCFKEIIVAYPQFKSPPLPFYLFYLLMLLGLSGEEAAIGINLSMGTFTPLIMFFIAQKFFNNKKLSLLAALLVAVNPSMNHLAIKAQRDMVFLFFSGLMINDVIGGCINFDIKKWIRAGFFCGCAVLSRFEGIEFLLIIPTILMTLFYLDKLKRKRIVLNGFALFISFCLTVVILLTAMGAGSYYISSLRTYYSSIGEISE